MRGVATRVDKGSGSVWASSEIHRVVVVGQLGVRVLAQGYTSV